MSTSKTGSAETRGFFPTTAAWGPGEGRTVGVVGGGRRGGGGEGAGGGIKRAQKREERKGSRDAKNCRKFRDAWETSKPDRAKSQGAGGDKEGSVAHEGTKEEWAGLEGKMDEELVVWEEELLALATQGPASSQQPPPRPPTLPAARYHDRLILPTVPGSLHCLQPRSPAATIFFFSGPWRCLHCAARCLC